MPQLRKLQRGYIGHIAVTAVALLSGCRHAPISNHMNYQLVPRGSSAVLIPPTQSRPLNPNAPSFNLTIKNARHTARSTSNCDIEGDLITLQWEEKTANVKIKSQSFVAESDAGVATHGPQKMFLDPLQSIEKFRNDLANLETNGCLRPSESKRLKVALSEKLPLPSEAGYRFRFGSFELTGIFDLVSDFRLHITGPVYASVTNDSTKQIIGFEHAYYIFTPAEEGDRTRISLDSVTETDRGKDPFTKSAPQNTLNFPESFGYFRIVFRTDAAASEHISIATILSAREESILAKATDQLASGPADSCEAVTAPGANCMLFPARVGVSIELGVRVNGREVFVGIGGALSEAIKADKPSAEIEKTLQVRRLYQGRLIPVKFDPQRRDIFGLILMPGDEVTF